RGCGDPGPGRQRGRDLGAGADAALLQAPARDRGPPAGHQGGARAPSGAGRGLSQARDVLSYQPEFDTDVPYHGTRLIGSERRQSMSGKAEAGFPKKIMLKQGAAAGAGRNTEG